jgi:small-conductance mechanosensitive channel
MLRLPTRPSARMSIPLPDDLQTLYINLQELIQTPAFWSQIGVLILAAAGAMLVHLTLGQNISTRSEERPEQAMRRMALKTLQRILFPISMLIGVLTGRGLMTHLERPVNLLELAVPLLTSMAAIRLVVYFLRKSFKPSPAVKAWENLIAMSIWIIVALHLLGWLPAALAALDAVALDIGTLHISVLAVGKLILSVALLWILALWLAALIENRISQTEYVNIGMRVALVKLSKFILLVLAFLLALNVVGIDLTALTVFGGALGVGLGFGLQRIASNFISGFIVLFDRSIRPGDVITIDNTFGWVQELHARYVVVRDRDGVERLIPNETLITTEVINWSYSDRNVRLKIPVSISYDNDPEQAMQILLACANANARVLADPPPAARLMNFGDNGIDLELRVWIQDPEAGLANVRSDVNIAIWRAFKAAGIVIPYPQRDLHIVSGLPAGAQQLEG